MVQKTGFSYDFKDTIWNISVSKSDPSQLLIELRKEKEQTIEYQCLDFKKQEVKSLNISNQDWWTQVEGYDGEVYVSKYKDRTDPTNKVYLKIGKKGNQEVTEEEVNEIHVEVNEPVQYLAGTEHFQLVSDFLCIPIAEMCEYLEYGDKIIISYYLRLDKGFQRKLIILEEGKELFEATQDEQMKGIASGSFFVHDSTLFFIKERNEVFVYPL